MTVRALPVISDPRGNLTFMQCGDCITFVPSRVEWYTDMAAGDSVALDVTDAPRLVVALSGGFMLTGDGHSHRMYRPGEYAALTPGMPYSLAELSGNAVALVVTGPRPSGESLPLTPGLPDSHAVTILADAALIDLDSSVTGTPSHRVTSLTDTPLTVRRIFYLYDVPAGSTRGGHSHINAREVIVAAAGSFDVTLADGHDTRTFRLSNPARGLYIPPGLWRNIDNFSAGSVCLVLTTIPYSESDYVRDYDTFKAMSAVKRPR